MRRYAACAALVTAMLVGVMGAGVPAVSAQSGGAAPPFFGVVREPGAPAVPESLGVTWERITFDWAAFQPEGPGDFVAGAVNPTWLDQAREAGREVVGLIVGTPGWASESGEPGGVPIGLGLAADDPGNLWAAFVTRLAETYGPQGVRRWIVFDGQDVRRGEGRVRFAGDEAAYARLLRLTRDALDAVDPGAGVIVGAAEGWADAAAGRAPYLARLLRALAAESGALPFEAVLVRATAGTEDVWNRLGEARAILAAAGHREVAIWVEAGMRADPAALLGLSAARQADFVAQAAMISRAAGAQRFVVVSLADHAGEGAEGSWGLMTADGTARPALDAYRAVIDLFSEAEAVRLTRHPAADVIEAQVGGRQVFGGWARGDLAVELRVTSPGQDEEALLLAPGRSNDRVKSGPGEWPAAFIFSLDSPEPDARGFLTVAGAPRLLVVEDAPTDTESFFRVVWLVVEGQYVRLR